MFELFGSDSEKKEEIDKNMEQIKDMVGGGDAAEPQHSDREQQSQGRDLPEPRPESDTASHDAQPSSLQQQPDSVEEEPIQAEGRQPQRSTQQQPETPTESTQSGADRSMPGPGSRQQPSQNTPTGEPQQHQESEADVPPQPAPDEDTEPSPPERSSIPEAPETKEINVPDIEKGPLFIRVKKFKEAKKLIHQMQDLSEDVETDMGGLQNTLEEDREVQRDLKGRLKKIRDSMKSIHTIVSP